jgi:small subunit ribosomal protein S6e
MAEFKLVISNAKGHAVQKEVKDDQANSLINKVIGDKISGDSMGFPGYEFEITGGSDNAGFPMRKDLAGRIKRRILSVSGKGIHVLRGEGTRIRKTIAGNTVYEGTAQINLKVLKEGSQQIVVPKEKQEGASDKADKKEAK